MSVYTSYADRVNYACRVILNHGPYTRAFDATAEMGDGDKVTHAILRRSTKNPRLLAAIKHDNNGRWFDSLVKLDNERYGDAAIYPLGEAQPKLFT